MRCERNKAALAEAALGAPASPELEAHLMKCPACQAELEEQRRLLSSIDRGLEAVLRIEPSPELAVRVRQRLGEEQDHPRPSFAAWVPASAAVLAALALVVIGSITRHAKAPEATERAATAAPQTLTPLGPAPDSSPELSAAVKPSPPRPMPRHAGVRPQEPEVLVPPGQGAAIVRFHESLRQRQVGGSSLLASRFDPEAPGFLEPEDLEIAPLEEKPLTLAPIEPASSTFSIPEGRSGA